MVGRVRECEKGWWVQRISGLAFDSGRSAKDDAHCDATIDQEESSDEEAIEDTVITVQYVQRRRQKHTISNCPDDLSGRHIMEG